MPSTTHEVIRELFENRPQLAAELLRDAFNVPLPNVAEARIGSTDLTDVAPTEYRADLVVRLGGDNPALGIIVEVQLKPDKSKKLAWPAYVANLRARLKCPTCLLVVTPSESVATWARKTIVLGPGSSVTPFAVGPSLVPQITDAEMARRDPELAVLSVMAHGRGDPITALAIANAAFSAIALLDDERSPRYNDWVLIFLGKALRETMMATGKYEYQSDFAKKYFAEGEARGKAEGEARGKAEGEARGKAEGAARSILIVLESRGLVLNPAQQERIRACSDHAVLDRWVRRAATVSSATELFAD